MITEIERKQLLQDIKALTNYVPQSEQWRIRTLVAGLQDTLRYVAHLETYLMQREYHQHWES